MMFVQFCAHLGVVIEPGKNVREMIYPVLGGVAYQRIVDKVGYPGKINDVCRCLQSELSSSSTRWVFMDEIETLLCEDEEDVNELDTFVKGQALFRLDDDGKPLVKLYGDHSVWTEVASLLVNGD
jgi:hypothetical protein